MRLNVKEVGVNLKQGSVGGQMVIVRRRYGKQVLCRAAANLKVRWRELFIHTAWRYNEQKP